MGISIIELGPRKIAFGIGKLFFESGFPISMAITELAKKGIEVSIFHVADECMKNGWTPKTTFNKIKADFEGESFDSTELQLFCESDYETQRKMIFNYLFTTQEEAITWGKNNLT